MAAGTFDICEYLQMRRGENGHVVLEMEVEPLPCPACGGPPANGGPPAPYFEGVEMSESDVRYLRDLCDDFLARRL